MISHDERQRARNEAAAWAVRLGEADPAAPYPEALQHWLAENPQRASLLQEARETWAELGALDSLDEPVPSPAGRDVWRSPARARRRLRYFAGAAAVLLVWLAVTAQVPQRTSDLFADHATGIGERRQVTLPDGSLVELDADSALDVVFDGERRLVRLRHGEAIFLVAPMGEGETRPFLVESAGGSSRALGTRFVVGGRGGGAWVGVLEHSVEVSAPHATGERQRILEEGQSVWYDSRGIHPLQADLANATAWRDGLLVFENRPLEEVIERLQHYRRGYLLIADRQLAQRRVNGVFRLDSLDQSLDLLVQELGASRLDLPGLTLIR
ncbi:FecR domain-containing protein [Pseudomonas lopnurensis]|uniref:FecR domain-containing protein n=1 Tax=Pseudomonas lopnurensis TaxID=1477517 RepID=UPI001879FD6C|nr:FecR family protein [Pseudomonas lopnurensis]MBE7373277.1 FecR family protein [Pseudomonas lopnurensis]